MPKTALEEVSGCDHCLCYVDRYAYLTAGSTRGRSTSWDCPPSTYAWPINWGSLPRCVRDTAVGGDAQSQLHLCTPTPVKNWSEQRHAHQAQGYICVTADRSRKKICQKVIVNDKTIGRVPCSCRMVVEEVARMTSPVFAQELTRTRHLSWLTAASAMSCAAPFAS